MQQYLVDDVGLKPDAAEAVANFMAEEFEVESVGDLKHLSK